MSAWENEEKTERNREIVNLYAAGMTGEEIGRLFGVSSARVRQLLNRVAPPSTLKNKEIRALRRNRQWTSIDPTDPRFRYGGRNRNLHVWIAHERNKAKRRRHLELVQQWCRETGRHDPTRDEIAELLGYSGHASVTVALAFLWGRPTYKGTRRPKTYRRYVARFARLAGITIRPMGHHGHLA